MRTKAIRIYGKNDLRLDEFELPAIKDDEILAHVICDSICMSSYKIMEQEYETGQAVPVTGGQEMLS
jgi:L-sorbose 1-phosphate reductase